MSDIGRRKNSQAPIGVKSICIALASPARFRQAELVVHAGGESETAQPVVLRRVRPGHRVGRQEIDDQRDEADGHLPAAAEARRPLLAPAPLHDEVPQPRMRDRP